MTGHGWLEMTAAFALFLASHSLAARRAIRAHLVRALGEAGYLVLYSLVSLLALAWLVVAAGRALRRAVGVCAVAAVGAEPGDARSLPAYGLRRGGSQPLELRMAQAIAAPPTNLAVDCIMSGNVS